MGRHGKRLRNSEKHNVGSETRRSSLGYYEIEVRHDSWCGMYSGKPCNCDPEMGRTRDDGVSRRVSMIRIE